MILFSYHSRAFQWLWESTSKKLRPRETKESLPWVWESHLQGSNLWPYLRWLTSRNFISLREDLSTGMCQVNCITVHWDGQQFKWYMNWGGTFSVPFGVVSPKFQSLNSTSTIFCHIHAPSILLLTLFFTLNQIITLKHLFQKEFDLVSQVENSISCQKQEAIITITIIHTKHFLKF